MRAAGWHLCSDPPGRPGGAGSALAAEVNGDPVGQGLPGEDASRRVDQRDAGIRNRGGGVRRAAPHQPLCADDRLGLAALPDHSLLLPHQRERPALAERAAGTGFMEQVEIPSRGSILQWGRRRRRKGENYCAGWRSWRRRSARYRTDIREHLPERKGESDMRRAVFPF